MNEPAPAWRGGLLVALLLVPFHGWYAYHGLALFDLGLLTDGALRVLHGEVFARDFLAPYGPLRYWATALVFLLFGSSVATFCGFAVVLQSAADGALYAMARAMGVKVPGALCAALMLALAHGSLHKSFLLGAILLVLGAVLWLSRRRDGWSAAGAGLLAGIAFLLRYDAGAFGALCLLLLAALERPARGTRLAQSCGVAAGFAALVGTTALFLVVAGASLTDWWELTWQRISVQERITAGFPWPWRDRERPLRALALSSLLLAAPALALCLGLGAAARLRRRCARSLDSARLTIGLFSLLLLNQARLIPSSNHLFQVLAPVYLALVDLSERRAARWLRVGLPALALVGLVAFVWTGTRGPYPGSFTTREAGQVLLDLPAAGIWIDPAEAAAIESTVRSIQERIPPAGRLGFGPGAPLFCFLAERLPGVPFGEPSYYYHHDAFQRRVIDQLERFRPVLFVHDQRPSATFYLAREAPLVWRYLMREYRLWKTHGPFQLFERR